MSPEQIADDKDDYNTDQDGGQVYLSRARFAAASVCVSESKKYRKNLNLEIYVKKLFAHIFLPVYMLAIAGLTAGPNGLQFFKGTLEYPGGNID